MSQPTPRPTIWTPERSALSAWLQQHAPRLGAPYDAAVRLLDTPDFPARQHLLGHLVREVANGLPEAISGRVSRRFDSTKALNELAASWSVAFPEFATFAEAVDPAPPSIPVDSSLIHQVSKLVRDHKSVSQTNRDKTALLIDALRPGTLQLRPALEPVLREWAAVVEWFVSLTHVPRGSASEGPSEAELERRFRQFEAGLQGITEGHFLVVSDIDALLESALPSDEALSRLMPLLTGAEQLRHFFAHPSLQDPRWLDVLNSRGFFHTSRVPEPILDEERSIETHLRWPASAYLVRMASHTGAENTVAQIASQILTRNTFVRDDLVHVTSRLPASVAARVVPAALANLQQAGWRWAPLEEVGKTLVSLAKAGERDAALRLLRSLVEVIPDPAGGTRPSVLPPTPITRVDTRTLGRTLGHCREGIALGLGLEGLEVLAWALHDALRLSRSDADDDGEDYSHIWLPRIECGDDDDLREVLVTAVREVAETVVQHGAALPGALEVLMKHRWPLFRRLELYLLTRASAPPPDLLVARILDRNLFDAVSTRREYRMLVHTAFAAVPDDGKRAWLAWIDTGIPTEQMRSFLEQWRGPVSDEDVARAQRHWQWERLAPAAHELPQDWEGRWLVLRTEFGEPEPADKAHYSGSVGAIRWESPASEEQLEQLSPSDLAAYLRAPVFPSDRPFATPEGLRERVASTVARSPEPYAREARAFEGLPPVYVRGVLDGFAMASKEGRQFDWSGALALASWVLEQPVLETEPEPDTHQDIGWAWTRWTIIRLLEDALKAEPSSLPLGFRARIWALLDVLLHDVSPQRRAEAFSTAIHFASWVRIQQGQSWKGGGTLDDLPEVRSALDLAIGQAAPSPVVHDAVGRWVPWLVFIDEAWVRRNLQSIFPTDGELAPRGRAAWRGYLRSGAPFNLRVFDALRPVYEQVIAQLEREDQPEAEDDDVGRELAEHLAVLHGNGTLAKRDASSLLDRFFAKARPGLRRHLFWFVGHDLAEQAEATPADVLRRFQDLWEARRESARTDPAARCELPSFGMWFGCRRFDDEWSLAQLEHVLRESETIEHEHLVVERLASLVATHTLRATSCFGLLVRRLREPGPVHGWREHAKTILGAAIRSADAATRGEGRDAFHKLGSLGFAAQDLVAFSDDLDDPDSLAYFTSDQPMTVAEIGRRLAEPSEPERHALLGRILRGAKDQDVWRFVTREQIAASWPELVPYLGGRQAYWRAQLEHWKVQGLLQS